MQDNRTTPIENDPLDPEDWDIALAPYVGHPGAALQLACHFVILQAFLKVEPVDVERRRRQLIAALRRFSRTHNSTGFATICI